MKWIAKKIVTLTLFTLLAGLAEANTMQNPVLPDSNTLQWMDAKDLPKGAKVAILAGNPAKKEFFVAQVKFPAGFEVPMHMHNINEYDTVISGTYYLGWNEKMSHNQMTQLPAGSFIAIPAKMLHFGWAKKETVIQVTGIGPWGMVHPKQTRG